MAFQKEIQELQVGGGRGVLHDSNRNVVLAYACFLGTTTNLQVEVKALLFGVRCYRDRGLDKLHIESDSLILISILQKKSTCPL